MLHEVGLCICVFDLSEVGEGRVRYGDGFLWYKGERFMQRDISIFLIWVVFRNTSRLSTGGFPTLSVWSDARQSEVFRRRWNKMYVFLLCFRYMLTLIHHSICWLFWRRVYSLDILTRTNGIVSSRMFHLTLSLLMTTFQVIQMNAHTSGSQVPNQPRLMNFLIHQRPIGCISTLGKWFGFE